MVAALGGPKDILSSFNIKNIDDCLHLYRKYLLQMNLNKKKFGDNLFNIKYEKLLTEPENIIPKIYDFCEIKKGKIEDSIKLINKNNLNKYNNIKNHYSNDLLDALKDDF